MKTNNINEESYKQYLENYNFTCRMSSRDTYSNNIENVYERIYYWLKVKNNLEVCYRK